MFVVAMLIVLAAAAGACCAVLRRRGGPGGRDAVERGAMDHEFARTLGTTNATVQNSVAP
ncbi:hypothetical protein JQK87_27065 [Streptomyces sp. G44]|uniref:hypothetical protein n=1 Tax=Streptomyces sp. G44 TaxID=2807632 RepID=UPI0019612612|nr:hypothetical protein [Streptomyces sp. G44]MBM7171987.1 hypothetical protein [Streptomyces sp. G44]